MGSLFSKKGFSNKRAQQIIEAIINDDPSFVYIQSDLDLRLEAYDWTPLHLATWLGKQNAIQKLLELSPNLNITDCHGETVLHLAAYTKSIETFECLKSVGADTTIENHAGETPFDLGDMAKQSVVASEEKTRKSHHHLKPVKTKKYFADSDSASTQSQKVVPD
ncbi:unnamed protein product [Blepharisma stoltei]|uniref:Uncharacterized protein n=1 Tax=Blepharisma stoltei TaxID=1481888 RepID=A0AAU9ISY3_9CILI|nr:unnamed protein product [Blepharisma stoltei]